MGGFEKIHPGGRFTLTKNYGRDISKYYYGGYVLVSGKDQRAYTHSQVAIEIVKSMVVGTLVVGPVLTSPMQNQPCPCEHEYYITRKSFVALDTYTF